MSPAVAADSFRGLDAETREKLAALPSNDAVFAEAIKEVGRHHRRPEPAARTRRRATRARTRRKPASPLSDRIRDRFWSRFPGLLRNIPPIEQAAAGRGLFSIDPERDGIVRRVPVVMDAQDGLVPSLTMEMLRVVSRSAQF